MALNVLGLGEVGTCETAGEALAVIALGSCVALVMTSRDFRIAAMAHVVLPEAPTDPGGHPCGYYPERAVTELLARLRKRGIAQQDVVVKLIGGGRIGDAKNQYRIGKRNVIALRRELWKLGMVPSAELVGKRVPLTVDVRPGAGGVVVSSPGESKVVL